jgi:hypothetical protein
MRNINSKAFLILILSMFMFATACRWLGLPAKKSAQTIQGATFEVHWLNYLNKAEQFDTVIVTPFYNVLGNTLPHNIQAVIPQAIREGLTEKVMTPGITYQFELEPKQATKHSLVMDNIVVFYDEKLDDRTLVMRMEIHRPQSDSLLASANIVARMSGFRGDPEITKGIRKGLTDAMEVAYKGLVEHPEEQIEEYKEEQKENK